MDKFIWENEIDTPSRSFIIQNSDELIKKFPSPSEIKCNMFVELLYKVWPHTIFFAILGIAISLPLIFTHLIAWDVIFPIEFVCLLIAAIIYVISRETKDKKNKRVIKNNEVFKCMSETFGNIFITEASYGSESSIVGPLPRSYEITDNSMIKYKYSYKFVGMYNGQDFEFFSTRWSTAVGIRTSGSIIIKLKEKFDSKITIAVDYIKMENKLVIQDLENSGFNDVFNIYGDPVLARKIFNTTEQDKYIKLNDNAGKVQIDIVDDVAIIAFPLRRDYISSTCTVNEIQNSMWDTALENLIKDYEVFMNYFSYFSVLRYFK